MCFTVSMTDNESAGVYIDQWNPNFGDYLLNFIKGNTNTPKDWTEYNSKSTPLNDITGTIQKWYMLNDTADGHTDTLRFCVSAPNNSETMKKFSESKQAYDSAKVYYVYSSYLNIMPKISGSTYDNGIYEDDNGNQYTTHPLTVVETDKDAKELISATMEIEPSCSEKDISYSPLMMRLSDLFGDKEKLWSDVTVADDYLIFFQSQCVLSGGIGNRVSTVSDVSRSGSFNSTPIMGVYVPDNLSLSSLVGVDINQNFNWDKPTTNINLPAGYLTSSDTYTFWLTTMPTNLELHIHVGKITSVTDEYIEAEAIVNGMVYNLGYSSSAENNDAYCLVSDDVGDHFTHIPQRYNGQSFSASTTVRFYNTKNTNRRVVSGWNEYSTNGNYSSLKVPTGVNENKKCYVWCLETLPNISKTGKNLSACANDTNFSLLYSYTYPSGTSFATVYKNADAYHVLMTSAKDLGQKRIHSKSLFAFYCTEQLDYSRSRYYEMTQVDLDGVSGSVFFPLENGSQFHIELDSDDNGAPTLSMTAQIPEQFRGAGKIAEGSVRVYYLDDSDGKYHFVYGQNFSLTLDSAATLLYTHAYVSLTDDRSKTVLDNRGQTSMRVANYASASDWALIRNRYFKKSGSATISVSYPENYGAVVDIVYSVVLSYNGETKTIKTGLLSYDFESNNTTRTQTQSINWISVMQKSRNANEEATVSVTTDITEIDPLEGEAQDPTINSSVGTIATSDVVYGDVAFAIPK